MSLPRSLDISRLLSPIRRLPPAAVMTATSVVAAVAVVGLAPPARVVALAGAGGLLVAATELAHRRATLRAWPKHPSGRTPEGSLARAATGALAAGAVSGSVSWLAVVAISGASPDSAVVLVLGGAAAVAVPILLAIGWTGQPGTARARRAPPEPSERGRRHGRGTRRARPGRRPR